MNDLATMVAKGFENTSTKDDVKRLETRIASLEGKTTNLETGQKDIKSKLDNVVYKYELVKLERRVEVLERQSGIKT